MEYSLDGEAIAYKAPVILSEFATLFANYVKFGLISICITELDIFDG